MYRKPSSGKNNNTYSLWQSVNTVNYMFIYFYYTVDICAFLSFSNIS